MPKLSFNGGIEITFKDLVWLFCLIVAVATNVALMPGKIEADLAPRFVAKEVWVASNGATVDRLDRIESKLDRVIECFLPPRRGGM